MCTSKVARKRNTRACTHMVGPSKNQKIACSHTQYTRQIPVRLRLTTIFPRFIATLIIDRSSIISEMANSGARIARHRASRASQASCIVHVRTTVARVHATGCIHCASPGWISRWVPCCIIGARSSSTAASATTTWAHIAAAFHHHPPHHVTNITENTPFA
jgi:hypothetical protein